MTAEKQSTPLDKDMVYLCRASGEGSHDFRVCADDAAVFAFYEEMCGRDQDGTLDSITRDFHDADAWSHEGQAYDIELYCARFEVWKVPAKDLQAPQSERGFIDRNAIIEECVHAIGELPGGEPERDRALYGAMVALRALKVTQTPGELATAQADTLGSGVTGRKDGPSNLSATPANVPIGLFWQTADGRWHFSAGASRRGDIHDNGRSIRIALLGEEAK